MVGHLIKKVPQVTRKDWVDWSSSQEGEAIPGDSDWPVFMKWLATVRKAELKDRWYKDPEYRTTSVPQEGKTTASKSRMLD